MMETINNFEEELKLKFSRYVKVFSYACLLHDVGHAPFSHTGNKNARMPLKQALDVLKDLEFPQIAF